jgi:hypothetical protein
MSQLREKMICCSNEKKKIVFIIFEDEEAKDQVSRYQNQLLLKVIVMKYGAKSKTTFSFKMIKLSCTFVGKNWHLFSSFGIIWYIAFKNSYIWPF